MSNSAAVKSGASGNETNRPPERKRGLSANMKVVLIAGTGFLAIGSMILAAMPEPVAKPSAAVWAKAGDPANSSGTLQSAEKSFRFGSISMGAGKVAHSYWIRNTGAAPVTISKLYTSCMCTTAALVKAGKKSAPFGMPGHGVFPSLNEPMSPGEEAFVEVVFDPAAHGPAGIGPIERVVTIENSAGRPLELAFNANVTP